MASNRVAANLLMLGILAAGLVSLTGLDRESWPKVPFNTIEVSVAYPGATPEEVEESIGISAQSARLPNVQVAAAGQGPISSSSTPRPAPSRAP